jgi:predicted PurR-regulated permease PerM
MADSETTRSVFDISWRAIAKVLIAIALVWMFLKLWELAMVVLISILIAVAIDPIVNWLEDRKIPRGIASSGCILLLACAVVALLMAGWSSITQQGRLIAESLVDFYRRVVTSYPMLEFLLPGRDQFGTSVQQYVAAVGASFARAFMLLILGMILTVYLSIEWKRTVEWLMAFVPKAHRARVRLTLSEAQKVMAAYVVGNVATSVFATIFVFVTLSLLKVPAALLLALLAGVFDFIPVLGFVLSAVPALVLASTVSPFTVVIVAGCYAFYHFVENYFIGPKVYGAELRLSSLAVLMSFAIGAELFGVIGALLALPVAAVYPAVERIWLSDRLETDTVEKHKRLEQIKTSA